MPIIEERAGRGAAPDSARDCRRLQVKSHILTRRRGGRLACGGMETLIVVAAAAATRAAAAAAAAKAE